MNRRDVLTTFKELWILLAAPLILLGPRLVQGEVIFWGTPALQFIPWWTGAYRNLLEGILPLWNPLNGMGAPLLANYQTAFLYPPNWLLLVFAGLWGRERAAEGIAVGFTVLSILHMAWAGLGMGLLLRRLRFGWLAQIAGGLAFGLAGYIVARLSFFSMVWVAAWLPWVIFFADAIASPCQDRWTEKARIPVGLTICLSMQLLAGHAQLSWYSMILAGAWVAVGALIHPGMRLRRVIKALLLFATAVTLAALIASPQLIPTFEYLQNSQRADAVSYEDALTYSYWPWRLITLAAPDFFGSPADGDYWGYASYWEDHLYIGVTPLLLALTTLWLLVKGVRRSKRPERWGLMALLWAGTAVTFLIAMGRFTPLFPFLYRYLPTFDMFQAPARYLFWAAFALPILAAVGVENWRCPTGRGLYWFRLWTASAFATTFGAGAAWMVIEDVRVTFIRSLALTGTWALGFGLLTLVIPYAEKYRRLRLWKTATVIWILADLVIAGWSLNPGTHASFFRGSNPAPVNPGERVYISAQEEYDLKFRRFFRFNDFHAIEDLRALRAVRLPNLNLLDGAAWMNNFDPLVSDTYARWMDAVEGMAPEVRDTWLAWAGVGAVEHVDISAVMGVRFDPLPNPQRVRWSGCAVAADSNERAWKLLETEMLAPVRADRPIILEVKSAPICIERGESGGRVEILSEKGNWLTLQTESPLGGYVVVMDSWYPGWKATIDGKPVDILRADGSFRAVEIPAGKHEIRFLYCPAGFYFGFLFSILVTMFLIIRSVIWGRKPMDWRS